MIGLTESIGITERQWAVLAKGMKSIWTNEYFLKDEFAVKTWYALLKDIPYGELNIAIQKTATTKTFPPTIAEVREAVASLGAEVADWSQGWEELNRAIRRFGVYGEKEALAAMSKQTATVAKRLGWKTICTTELDEMTALRANFRQIYTAEQAEEQEKAKLPQNLKAVLENKTKLIGGTI